MQARETVTCDCGRGLVGDRYHAREAGHRKQITFFDLEVHRQLCRQFPQSNPIRPDVYRRNVVLEGIDLNRLIGGRFRIGRVLFEGVEECRPCYWMDAAVGPGAEAFLKGRGGLRAKILQGGVLQKGGQDLVIESPGE